MKTNPSPSTERVAQYAERQKAAGLEKVSASGWVRTADAEAVREALREALAPYLVTKKKVRPDT